MGNGSSKSNGGDEIQHSKPSRRSRLRQRLHLHRHRSTSSDSNSLKSVAADDFAGIARIEIIGAEMMFKDRWLACLSLGERTYRTEVSEQLSEFELFGT